MAYISPATLASIEQQGDGNVRLVIRFVGDAGEPPVLRQFTVSESMVVADVRRYVYDEIRRLNAKRGVFTGVTIGQNIPELAPSVVAPTAKQVWREKVARFEHVAGLGLTGAAGTAVAALKADIETTYAAGHLD